MTAEIFKYFTWLFTPLGLWCVGAVLLGLGVIRPGRFRQMIWLVLSAQLIVFSLPVTADFLMGQLEKRAREMQVERPIDKTLSLVVVLGGATGSRYEGYRDFPDLNEAADRIWVAADMIKRGLVQKILVTGGTFSDDQNIESEAVSMRYVLERLGVPPEVIVEERKSRTTLENAWHTKRLLALEAEAMQVALVTSAFHMPRAVALFEQAGLQVFPVISDVRVIPDKKSVWHYFPSASSLDRSTIALKERLGWLQLYVKSWFEP